VATIPRLLTVRTRKLHAGESLNDRQLLDLLPDDATLSWVCRDEGLVGWGVAARLDAEGPDRFAEADAWWHRLCGRTAVDDEVQLPGTGPVVFASMAFADHPGRSVLVVPEVVIGQRNGVRWITTVGDTAKESVAPGPIGRPGTIRYSDGELSATGYRAAVAEAVRRMRRPDGAGQIDKVVLAHDLLATTSQPLDPRFLLRNLSGRYPNCWTFAVDGLIGATPELLLERTGNQIRSRVLAGTIWPREGVEADHLADELLTSAKNRNEHRYAVESLATRLRPFCDQLTVPEGPEVMRLRNVMHLASNVWGLLSERSASDHKASLLRMAEAVHPTAAVGGTPTQDAVGMINELEPMDRERYAGPVGWIDGDGNGEFGIALRCAQIQPPTPDGGRIRLFAGCGIVADSDPDLEVAEAEAKLLPIREALEGV
jgi:menaquinone-specific isochorismate synthase